MQNLILQSMYALLSKEFRSIFNSLSGILFPIVFLITCGCMHWLIPGNYNIPESGYASLSSFFALAPVLLLVLIPALSMRVFSEEKKQGSLSLLLTRPIRLFDIVLAKYLSVFIVVFIVLLPTIIYVFSLAYYALPQGNIDWGAIAGSYLGLMFLTAAFIAVSVYASSLTSNQVIAFITGLLISIVFYFGFDLVAYLFPAGKTQYIIRKIGFLSHYQSIQKGVIDSFDAGYLLLVSVLFLSLTLQMLRTNWKRLIVSSLIFIVLWILCFCFTFRLDLTADKRYTLSKPVKALLKEIKSPVEIECYLTGDLNAGLYQLQKACVNMLNDFSALSSGNINCRMCNPYQTGDEQFVKILTEKGMRGIAVNERNREGKISQQVVFPYLLFKSEKNEIPVALLINEPGRSGQENLNTSIEMLEYHLAQALHVITRTESRKIVFLQGHGELTSGQLSDLFDHLAYNYQIDMGILSDEVMPEELNEYELLVLPGPQEAFSEAEKYILDQYIMHGGKILWVINGVKLDLNALSNAGATPSMANEVNLDDLLFNYGIRINPVLLKDVQCLEISLDTNIEEAGDSYISAPWYFAPVLNLTSGLSITKGVSLLKTAFASTLSFVGKNADNFDRNQVLLYSSDLSTVVQVPEMISLHEINRLPDKKYFNQKHLPVAALIEGDFVSGFKNRLVPKNVVQGEQAFADSVKNNKMIVVASEDVIRNEITHTEAGAKIWPLGYDRQSGVQFGNREFILNAINYLTDDSEISNLRTKHLQLRLLDKNKLSGSDAVWINTLLPPFLLLALFLANNLLRKRTYGKMQSLK